MTRSNFPAQRPLIMGILNVTPDSFSDGGKFLRPEDAIAQGRRLIAEGADILDIGGESTRPGATPVSIDEEVGRVLPVITGLANEGAVLSIDTLKPDVAEAAIGAGATIWNDVSALSHDPRSLDVAAKLKCHVILMHMQGQPQTMQSAPHYEDVVAEVETYLLSRAQAAEAAGVSRDQIWIDPGIGFGKNLDHNLSLIRANARLASHGYPLLMAASNKRFIAALEEREGAEPSSPDARLGGTLAVHLYALANGARMVRVHDVAAMKQALRVTQHLL